MLELLTSDSFIVEFSVALFSGILLATLGAIVKFLTQLYIKRNNTTYSRLQAFTPPTKPRERAIDILIFGLNLGLISHLMFTVYQIIVL